MSIESDSRRMTALLKLDYRFFPRPPLSRHHTASPNSISVSHSDQVPVLSGDIVHYPAPLAREWRHLNDASSTHPSLATSFPVFPALLQANVAGRIPVHRSASGCACCGRED